MSPLALFLLICISGGKFEILSSRRGALCAEFDFVTGRLLIDIKMGDG
jgi:hypothetical protein